MRYILPFCLLLCSLFSSDLAASIVTVTVSGQVNSVVDSTNVLGGMFNVGDAVTTTIIYDTAAINSTPVIDSTRYFPTEPPGSYSTTIGSTTWASDPNLDQLLIRVFNDQNTTNTPIGDRIDYSAQGSASTFPFATGSFDRLELVFRDRFNQVLLADESLPTALDISLANFSNGFLGSSDPTTSSSLWAINWTPTSFESTVAVPEPSSGVYIALLGVPHLFRRRRR